MKRFLFYDIEKSILNNLTRVIIYLILFLITIQILYNKLGKSFLDANSFITIIGAIIAFWYGYKNYERDKELEIVEKYTEKYNNVYKYIKNSLLEENNEVRLGKIDFIDILNLWYEEFFIYERSYISKELWTEWKNWIKEDIYMFMKKSYTRYNVLSSKEKNDNDYINSIIRGSDFVSSIGYFINHSKNNENIILTSNNFIIFIKNIVKSYIDNNTSKDRNEKDWDKITKKVLNIK